MNDSELKIQTLVAHELKWVKTEGGWVDSDDIFRWPLDYINDDYIVLCHLRGLGETATKYAEKLYEIWQDRYNRKNIENTHKYIDIHIPSIILFLEYEVGDYSRALYELRKEK